MKNRISANSCTRKLICVLFATLLTATICVTPVSAISEPTQVESYPFIFVEGYMGWGEYNKINDIVQYWGGMTGDLLEYLNTEGYECHASSVGFINSAWDRACNLYAQMTGTRTDYGQVHAAKYNHSRYGPDYTNNALLEDWGKLDENGRIRKVNFITHSFGGTAVRLLAQLLAYGSPEEMAGTTEGEVSGLFTGGRTNLIHSVTTLTCPHNGTTLTFLLNPTFNFLDDAMRRGGTPTGNRKGLAVLSDFIIFNTGKLLDKLIDEDTGVHDLTIDGAAELNSRLSALDGIYYFSIPADASKPGKSADIRVADMKISMPVLWPTINYMGGMTGITDAGRVTDSTWFKNDGVVNTYSAMAPENEPQKIFDPQDIQPGVWNIMDTYKGDHASIVGGVVVEKTVYSIYTEQMALVCSLPDVD